MQIITAPAKGFAKRGTRKCRVLFNRIFFFAINVNFSQKLSERLKCFKEGIKGTRSNSILVEKKKTDQIGLIMIGTFLKHTDVVSLFVFRFRDRAMNVLLNVFIIHCVKP